jgi:hypothetical protein
MLTQEERNWLEENDVLDRHIFGQLTEEEEARFQFLLDKDPSFLEEAEFNTAVIAAIRNKGRMEMKLRLRETLKTGAPAEPMQLHTSTWELQPRQWMPLILKAAAVIIILAGGTVLTYQLFFNKPVEAPIADKEIKKEQVPSQTETPKEESKQETKTDESKKIAAKKSTAKQKLEEKPMIAATPPGNLMQKHNQRFRAENFMMPKPNEVKAVIISGESKLEQETKILFKNSTDLVAVDIKETQLEQNGKLNWFYVVYENKILNVYIDNSKYLTLFKNARMTETAAALQIEIKGTAYTVDLSSKEKFKKAVIKP